MATRPESPAPGAGGSSDVSVKDLSVQGDQEKAGEAGTPVRHVSRFTRAYRSPLFNVIIVGLISFTQPGIWNALNSEYYLSKVD